ncbi:MAG: hypothetical protein AAF251_16825 [Pseudomonadota bacterium]
MKKLGLLGVGAGLAAMAALPGYSQTSKDAALEAACRATEVTMPDSCPCTITKARAAGVNNTQLASLFKDDGHSNPVPQAKYSAFWQVKSQCIADAMMASLGVSQGNPLPGVPAPMRPTMPGQAPAAQPPVRVQADPLAGPSNKRSDAPVPPGMLRRDSSDMRSLADVNAMIAQLANTAWEYTEDGGTYHRYDFLPEGNLAIYQTRDARRDGYPFAQVTHLSADENRFGAFIRTRDVTTGQFGDLPIKALTDNALAYQKRYVRSGEEWLFRKLGPAATTLPESAPERLEDGFWKVDFDPVSKNPLIVGRNGLQGTAGPANRTLKMSSIAGAANSAFLIGDQSIEDCNSSCSFIVNDFDRSRNRVRRRLIDEAGVDYVGVRPEPMSGEANVVSVRAFDGYGGWKEWRCSSQPMFLDCKATASKEAPQARPVAAQAETGSLLAALSAVEGETWGEAACSGDLYFFPANGKMPQGVDALFAHIRTQKSSHFATQVDVAAGGKVGYKLKLNGRDVVLLPVREGATSVYSNGALTLTVENVGPGIFNPNEPNYGFQQVRAEITDGSESESFDAIGLNAC